MSRELVLLRNAFRYFDKNKSWILSGLFIFSIIRDYVWYACFGVNILSYSTIQDTFVSLFNYMIIFTIIPFIYIFFSLLFSSLKNALNKILFKVIMFFIVIILSFIYFFLFKKFVSFIMVLAFFTFIIIYYQNKKYIQILNITILIFTALSIFSPMLNYLEVLNKVEKGKTMQFMIKEDNMDFFSFSYNKCFYDTSSKRYYLVGNTTNYFFLFDNKIDKTLIFPKSECKNIKTEVFILSNLSKK